MQTQFDINHQKHRVIPRMILLLAMLFTTALHATNYVWTGANSNLWSDPLNWSPNGVPGFADDVDLHNTTFSSSTPYNIVIDVNAACRNIRASLSPGAIVTGASHRTLYVHGYMDLANITWSYDGITRFESQVPGQTIHTAGENFTGPIYFDGRGGQWMLIDGLQCLNTIYLVNGFIDLNGKIMEMYRFHSDYVSPRGIDVNNGEIFVTQSHNYGHRYNASWDVETSTGFSIVNTASTGAGSIVLNGTTTGLSNSFASNNVTYPANVHISFYGNTGHMIGDNNFFGSLIFKTSGQFHTGVNQTNSLHLDPNHYQFERSCSLTVNNSFNALGTCAEWVTLTSVDNLGSNPYLFLGSVTSAFWAADYLVVNGVNTNSTGTIPTIINLQGSLGWPATSGISTNTLTWTGGAGNYLWSDPGNWSGTGVCPTPTPFTHVVFNSTSFSASNKIVDIDIANATCATMTWTMVTDNPQLISTSPLYNLSIFGTPGSSGVGLVTEPQSLMAWDFDGTTHFIAPQNTHTINIQDQVFKGPAILDGAAGNWLLDNSFTSIEYFAVLAGTLNTQGYDMGMKHFNSAIVNQRRLDLNSSTLTCQYGWDIYDHSNLSGPDLNMTLLYGTSTIRIESQDFQSYHDHGNDYYNLELNEEFGTQELHGNNTFHGDVTFLGNGIITNVNTYKGLLTFSPGKSYKISGLQTLDATGNLNAIGSCDGYIGIRGGEFLKTSGTPQAVEYCVIKDNLVSCTASPPNVSFSGTNSFAYGTTGCWSVTPPPAGDLYFKATTSNRWNDGNNWFVDASWTPQTGTACPPHPLNDVYFVDGAFGAYNTMDIDVSNAYCHSMYWKSSHPSITNSATVQAASNVPNPELHVFGDFILVSNNLNWDMEGTLRLEGEEYLSTTTAFQYDVDADGQWMKRETYFDGASNGKTSDWNLTSNFAVDYGTEGISLVQGTINTSNNIDAGHFHSHGSIGTRTLNITGTPNIRLNVQTEHNHSHAWLTSAPSTGFNLNASSNCTIFIDNVVPGDEAWLTASNVTFGNVQFQTDAQASVRGDDNKTFNNLSFYGNGNVQCGNTITNVLELDDGYIYHFEKNKTQTFGDLDATGSVGQVIYIRSSEIGQGNEASFVKTGSGDVCIDYASIRDNDASGARFYDGPTGYNVSNNTGWSFTSCGASQSYTGCAGVSIPFSTTASGTSFDWDFGNNPPPPQLGVGSTTSATYTTTGTFNGTVIGKNGFTEDLRYFTVTVNNNCCTATITGSGDATCNGGSDGWAQGLAASGLAPYTFNWSPGTYPQVDVGNQSTYSSLPAGTYTLVITGSAGCTATASVTITEPPALVATIPTPTIYICPPATASATVTASGGTAPYTFAWSPSGGTQTDVGNTSTYSNLTAGPYTVTVTDNNGCTQTANVTVSTIPFQGFPKQGEGAMGTDAEMTGITWDGQSQASYYVTGWFSGTLTLPDATSPITLTSAGGKDAFVAKYDQCGLRWARRYGDIYDDEGTGIVIDQMSGNLLSFCGNIEPNMVSNLFDPTSSYSVPPVPLTVPQSGFVAHLDETTGHTKWVTGFSSGQTSETRATGIHINRQQGHEYVHVSGQFNHRISTQFQTNVSTEDWLVNGTMQFDACVFSVLESIGQFDHIIKVGGIGDDIAHAVQADPTSNSQVDDYIAFTGSVNQTTLNPSVMAPAPTSYDVHGADGYNAFVARAYVDVYGNINHQRLITFGSVNSGGSQSAADINLLSATSAVVAFEHDGNSDMSMGIDAGGTALWAPTTGTQDVLVSRLDIPLCGPCTAIITNWHINPAPFHTDVEYWGGIENNGTEVFGVYNDQSSGSTDLSSFAANLTTGATTAGPSSASALVGTPAECVVRDVDMDPIGTDVVLSGYFTDDIDVSSSAPNLVNASVGYDAFAAKLDIPGSNVFLQKQGESVAEEAYSVGWVTVFPNPTFDKVNFTFPESATGQITVMDMYGKLLLKQEINETLTEVIDLSLYADGVYLIHFDVNDHLETHRIVKSH